MPDYKILKMDESHLAFIEQTETDCFAMPWNREQILFEKNNPNSRFLVLTCEEKEVAYGSFRFAADTAYINNIAVSREERRKGAGGMILSALINEAEALGLDYITLEVRVSNRAAICLYEKFGFQNCGIRPNIYGGPVEDGMIMTKAVK